MRGILICGVFLLCSLTVYADDTYLGKDGKLTGTLIVRDVQGGFAGFTGKQTTVKPSGEWEESSVFGARTKKLRSGKLTAKQLSTLAADLKLYNAIGLKSEGKTGANPHVVWLSFGKHQAELTLGAGMQLPKPDAATMPGRFSGIVAAVKKATSEK